MEPPRSALPPRATAPLPLASSTSSSDLGAGPTRRRVLGWVLAAPTLVVAPHFGSAPAGAAIGPVPSPPQPYDLYDLADLFTDASRPTAHLITITVNSDGTASFAMPRAEVGQGITTAFAMVIAEELDLAPERIRVELADARPELLFNQFTGASNSLHTLYEPVRTRLHWPGSAWWRRPRDGGTRRRRP